VKDAPLEPGSRSRWGLCRRRLCCVPTWRGWLLLFVLFVALANLLLRGLHPFLAVNAPVRGPILVVEGWASDQAMEEAIRQFQANHYEKMFVTGGPLEQGAPLSEYKTYAELGAATLLKLGMPTNALQAVPAPRVARDRTYTSALTLRAWFAEHGMAPNKIDLMSGGPHARRSRLLFEKAFGRGVTVGVVSLPASEYDPRHWWRSSQGFRVVTSEAIAYVYARVLFRAREP
jgi:hypothetical protein